MVFFPPRGRFGESQKKVAKFCFFSLARDKVPFSGRLTAMLPFADPLKSRQAKKSLSIFGDFGQFFRFSGLGSKFGSKFGFSFWQ